MQIPTGVKSNILKGSPAICSRSRATMMFGDVPISVTIPPSSEPKAIGINRLDGVLPVLRTIKKATGISMVRAPMFFTKPESTVTVPTSTATWIVVVVR